MSTDGLRAMITAFFDAMQIPINVGVYSFTLLDVFFGGVLLSVVGFAIGKIFFFFNSRR